MTVTSLSPRSSGEALSRDDGAGAALCGTAAQRGLWAWAALAAGSLAIAALFAIVLAGSRTPGMIDLLPADWNMVYQRVLVTHVVLASVVWCMAALGAMACLAAAPAGKASSVAAPALVLVGVVLVLVPTLAGLGQASVNDFVPVIVHPLYYAGLVAVAAGIAVPILALMRRLDRRSPFAVAVALAGAMALIAFLCFVVTAFRLPAGLEPLVYNNRLFWGGGHVMQFAYSALTLAGWHVLAERAYGVPPLPPRAYVAALATLVPFVLAAPVYSLVLDPDGPSYREAFTDLMRYGLVVAPLLVAAGSLRTASRRPCRDATAALALLLSISLFVLGGALGFFLPGGDTRTPAHYHASLSGVNLALMGVFWCVILPLLGRPPRRARLVRAQLMLFGVGQLVFALGLFLAGMEGVPRKTAGLAQGLDSTVKLVSMGFAGVGGTVAVAGGLLFVGLLLACLAPWRRPEL